jgi:peptidoglycan/LPS O-acetylase OafA/YrhL
VFSFHLLDYVPIDPVRSPLLVHFATIGAFGVSVFFLLSAFLITELLLKELAETPRIHVKAFYLRRILRIWPLYFAAFYGLAVLAHFLPEVGPTTRGSWLAFSLFGGNWYVTRYGWIAGPVDPLWSISVEEQFYILIPLIIASGRRAALAIAGGVFLLTAYAAVWLYAHHPSIGDNGAWTNSFVQFQFFAAGTLIALALRGRLPRFPIHRRIIGVALAICCWFSHSLS